MKSTPQFETYTGVKTVRHKLEFTIGRDERNGTVVLKTSQTHTLVEFNIFQLNTLCFRVSGCN